MFGNFALCVEIFNFQELIFLKINYLSSPNKDKYCKIVSNALKQSDICSELKYCINLKWLKKTLLKEMFFFCFCGSVYYARDPWTPANASLFAHFQAGLVLNLSNPIIQQFPPDPSGGHLGQLLECSLRVK